MTRIAYFDCLSGISGDMTLGAMIDLGVETAAIEAAVRSMGLDEVSIRSQTVKKCGFRAISVQIEHPPEHAHRHLHHITEMIDRASEIEPAAKETAHRIFRKLAEAEAKVHGSTLEKVHFHEVGAIDSIADIVGAAVAMNSLGIETVVASPVPTGKGEVVIAHGRVSIPAPATAELLCGIPLRSCDVEAELTTPTGAAILKACGESFGPVPSMTVQKVGYGAGSKDLESQANVLRVLLGEAEGTTAALGEAIQSDCVVVLETNLDDCTGQQIADCATRLHQAGALDVFQIPCQMKKARSGVILSVISPANRVALLEKIIFEHTTSIGIRRQTVQRHKLAREAVTVQTEFGPIRGKIATLPSGEKRFRAEDDDARAAAEAHHVTADRVRQAARTAWTS